jgi:hypothetical protein
LRVRGEPWGYGSHSAQPGTYELDPRGMAPYTTQGYGAALPALGVGTMTLFAAGLPILTGIAFWQLANKKRVTPWIGYTLGIMSMGSGALIALGGTAATAYVAAK